ncbi:MAG: hypothetical protein QGD89_02815 [Actinomycetota bacterium]|nr:hypothetical protein [Actinomycetota bacterium]
MTSPLDDGQDRRSEEGREEPDPGWPWSFLLLVGAGALYLILRVVDAVNKYVLN